MTPWPESQYLPHPAGYLLLLALVLGALMLFLRFVLVDYAFLRLGLRRWTAVTLLWGSLVGSAINIPVTQLPAKVIEQNTTVTRFGMTYVIPQVVVRDRTVIAINVGGALIPTLLSLYLVIRFGLRLSLVAAVLIATAIAHYLAHPVRGVGIAVPPLVMALVAAGAAILLHRASAPRTAYVAGSMGTLIGADLMNLKALNTMGAPVVSIGGAGTFDGVFITGVVAVLLAGIMSRGSTQGPEDRRAAAG